ncbi:MAG: DUF4293 domain-containing protein [Bacteroidales bacterium]|nr:DUF4293 domain-containing protein [Bacteroidales bacterium]
MLQRIQSFYLVLALVGIIMLFQFPIATYTMPNMTKTGEITSELQLVGKDSKYMNDTNDIMDITYIGQDLVRLKGGWVLMVLAGLVGVVALVSIFLFKNRVLQMRIVACGGLLNMIYIFLIFFWAINGTGGSGGYLGALQDLHITSETIAVNMWTPGTIIPIVTLILLYLAQRAIKKDEMKVRAADRLR